MRLGDGSWCCNDDPRSMKLIAVTQRVDVIPAYGERRDGCDQHWAEFLTVCGLVPLFLPNHVTSAQSLLSALPIAGLLLTGGNDLAAYEGNASERDAVETLAVDRMLAAALPVAGVCRGMQFLLDKFGANLDQVDGHVASRHSVSGPDGGREVNSYHRWAARHPGPILVASARSADGVVEAVRHPGEPILGIMWHPEREASPQAHDIALFRDFFTR